jgi:hypothetical protein
VRLDLLWWFHKRRPRQHISEIPLQVESAPWFVDPRPFLHPSIAAALRFEAPNPDRVRKELPIRPVGGNLLEMIERGRFPYA